MVRLARTAAEDVGAEHVADLLVIAHADEAGAEAVLRAGEDRHVHLLAEAIDGNGVGEGGRERSADVHRLACLHRLLDLLEMRSAVDAHDQHGVDLLEDRIGRVQHGDLVRHLDVLRPLGQLADALLDVGTAGGESGDDADACQVAAGLGVVPELREGHGLVVVQADDADLDRRRRVRRRHQRHGYQEQGQERQRAIRQQRHARLLVIIGEPSGISRRLSGYQAGP